MLYVCDAVDGMSSVWDDVMPVGFFSSQGEVNALPPRVRGI